MSRFGEQPQSPFAFSSDEDDQQSARVASATGVDRPAISFRAKLGPGGRVVIPAEVRSEMSIQEGDMLVGDYDGTTLSLSSYPNLISEIQRGMRAVVPEGVSVVDEFLAERRAMWGEDED